jgi:hypothetical protein
MQGLREIRPYKLPFSKFEGIGFRERKKASVNKVNSQTKYIIKIDTLLKCEVRFTYNT